jgi:hypothetical protein
VAPPAPARTTRTPTGHAGGPRQRGGEGGEPGRGVRRDVLGARLARLGVDLGGRAAARRLELGGARLARDADPVDLRRGARPVADHLDHQVAHRAGDALRDRPRAVPGRGVPGAGTRPVEVERRQGAQPAAGDRGRHVGHLQRRGLQAALADRARADRQVVADLAGGGQRGRCGARDRRGRVEAERLRRGHEPLRAELGAHGAKTELHDSAKACASVPPQLSPFAFWISTPSSVAAVCTG